MSWLMEVRTYSPRDGITVASNWCQIEILPNHLIYVQWVDMDFRVPTCGEKGLSGIECRLPLGHTAADIPHMASWSDPEGKFRTFVRVTDRDPRENQEASCEN